MKKIVISALMLSLLLAGCGNGDKKEAAANDSAPANVTTPAEGANDKKEAENENLKVKKKSKESAIALEFLKVYYNGTKEEKDKAVKEYVQEDMQLLFNMGGMENEAEFLKPKVVSTIEVEGEEGNHSATLIQSDKKEERIVMMQGDKVMAIFAPGTDGEENEFFDGIREQFN
ncbi:hypothetical protein [Paenibacillus gorillae]|uniref:hypothetical protein n=1 Tax=Paenibacillus gorillae TaxID=1243662 RepID=UPI0004B92D73|nr:hypothetical protein [Paenibacillus gorillae]